MIPDYAGKAALCLDLLVGSAFAFARARRLPVWLEPLSIRLSFDEQSVGITGESREQRCEKLFGERRFVFLRLSSPEVAISRVAARVKQGGHDVPANDIR